MYSQTVNCRVQTVGSLPCQSFPRLLPEAEGAEVAVCVGAGAAERVLVGHGVDVAALAGAENAGGADVCGGGGVGADRVAAASGALRKSGGEKQRGRCLRQRP